MIFLKPYLYLYSTPDTFVSNWLFVATYTYIHIQYYLLGTEYYNKVNPNNVSTYNFFHKTSYTLATVSCTLKSQNLRYKHYKDLVGTDVYCFILSVFVFSFKKPVHSLTYFL